MLTPKTPSEAARPIPDSVYQTQPAGPKAVGAMLHTRREELGRDLRQAADALRIRYPYLQAIEDGRVEDLPGPTYAVGFVRAYADHLGLDGEYIVARFKLENQGLEHHRAQLVFPSPSSETRIPSGAILLIAVALAAVAYGGWVYLSSSERSIADVVPGLPDNLAALLRSDPVPPAEAPAETADLPSTAAPAAAPPAETPSAAPPAASSTAAAPAAPAVQAPAAAVPLPAPSVPQAVAAVAPSIAVTPPAMPEAPVPDTAAASLGLDAPPIPAAGEARVYGEENAGARVVIRALSDSWVEVRDERSGELLLTRVLRTGDTYRVPDRSGLSLVTGNAGGIEIAVDGTRVGPIGPLGSVRRNLSLEPDSLRRMSAAN